MNSNLIRDMATREAVKKLEEEIRRINNIPTLSHDASLIDVIDAINKITKSLKRK